jgi:uncharacterized membrane protein YbhN (UPF0104 family)
MNNPAKIRKTYNYLISAVILLATWLFLYRQVFLKANLSDIAVTYSGFLAKPGVKFQLCTALLLVIVNWGIEAIKWKFLITKIEQVPLIKSFTSVLSGIAVSTFIPNRVGEYFGRVFILEKASRIEGILITILGSMSQLMVTILTGTFCLTIFIPRFLWNTGNIMGTIYWGLIAMILVIDTLLLLFYFNISLLATLKEKICVRKWRKYRKFFNVFSYYRFPELCRVISLSFLRWLVFSTQYYLLLRVFAVPVPLFEGLIIIAIIFFIMTIIPTIALTELGIRGTVAIYFFGIYFTRFHMMNETISVGILAASTLLWIINLAIPALAGSVLLFRLNYFRKDD